MRRFYAWIFALAAMLLMACSDGSARGSKAAARVTDFDVLTIKQSACLFDCPAFALRIFADGRVRHSGPTFEYSGGPHEARIDGSGLAAIAKALREARIDTMRDSYQDGADGCASTMTDMSTLTLNVSGGPQQRDKRVMLYTGCVGPTIPTERVNTLIKAIDRVTGTGALLEQRKLIERPAGDAAAPSK